MRLILFVSALLVLFSNCTKRLTPFTNELYRSQSWSDADLKKIQFYLSTDLVLYREFTEGKSAKISSGQIRVRNGRKVEEITIPAKTPGVFLQRPDSDHFAISFESGDDNRFLMFGPNPKRDGTYELLASEWNNRSGKVTYSGEKFQTQSASIPALLVDLDAKTQKKVSRKVASGRKVQ